MPGGRVAHDAKVLWHLANHESANDSSRYPGHVFEVSGAARRALVEAQSFEIIRPCRVAGPCEDPGTRLAKRPCGDIDALAPTGNLRPINLNDS
jgi:hypothetical protein